MAEIVRSFSLRIPYFYLFKCGEYDDYLFRMNFFGQWDMAQEICFRNVKIIFKQKTKRDGRQRDS